MKNKKGLTLNSSKGFTLIELLVVIAIIGILSSIVLSALNTARTKARDGAVMANLSSIRTEIELYYVENNDSYGASSVAGNGVCDALPFSGGNIASALAEAEVNGSGDAICSIGVNGDSWAVSVPLQGGGSWCVTSIGGAIAGVASGGGASTALCGQP